MNMKPIVFLFITILIICNTLTMYFLKKLSLIFISEYSFRQCYYIIFFKEFYFGILAGVSSLASLLYVNTQVELSRFIPILMAMVTLIVSSMGIVIFHETLTLRKVIGLVAVVFALILLSK
ncbi:MAG: hypothetical protein GY797_35780 [Deltaproteobacteria bacterium]|nr:hypothetical protein [Deltaproteobacteria bacterium]